eukprot:2220974-Amphidinium_carterae.1
MPKAANLDYLAPAPEKGAQDETAIEDLCNVLFQSHSRTSQPHRPQNASSELESKAEESYPTSDAFQSELSAKAEVVASQAKRNPTQRQQDRKEMKPQKLIDRSPCNHVPSRSTLDQP